MTLNDAVLALVLAAVLHPSDTAIRKTAERCARKLPRSRRHLMFAIAASPAPREVVRHIGNHLDRLDWPGSAQEASQDGSGGVP